uniref:DNA (cytosine-5)-methyltransferase DRM2 n=1 Tax=Leersia perrieri TaxID=77586 RepID=A0A0D9VNI1_9ORYZ
MVDWASDSGDDGKFDWETDDEAETSSAPALRNVVDAPGPSTRPRQDANGRANGAAPSALVAEFVSMGFTKEMVMRAVKEIGDTDSDQLVELLLTYQAIDGAPSAGDCSASASVPQILVDDEEEDDVNWDEDDIAGNCNRVNASDGSDDEEFLQELSEKDEKIKTLVSMGFPENEAQMAITRCGLDAPVEVLTDAIYASQTAGSGYAANPSDYEDTESSIFGGRNKTIFMDGRKRKRKRYGSGTQGNQVSFDGSHEETMPLPNPMVGFGLPTDRLRSVHRNLPDEALGPPYFYYENVALAPKGVWTTISRFLYDIQPEFVDSKYFCAAARKRGYIHNLPVENRSPLLPCPPKTIFEAFPNTRRWWPSWDPRRQFNCLQTCMASAKLTERIRVALGRFSDVPPPQVQKYVLDECRKWNLVWVGKNKVAHLEPDEMEFLLGYPRNHTRGVSRTERFKALGNSFQVDTVAYHLSVLRDMFPHGMNVLSLFSGIGGAEVALHRLGIRMKAVVSVEKSEVNRTLLTSWWDQTQTGTLIEIEDVRALTAERIESFVRRFGGFDLVIGGSPCNNLAGSNRHHRDGLEGEHSALFYDYFRILDSVKTSMSLLLRSLITPYVLLQVTLGFIDGACTTLTGGPMRKVVICTRSMLGSSNGAPPGGLVKKRKIVEHIILLRAKPNISDAEEKDMLDYLYTSQYQMRGILAVSLGRIEDPNTENFTHAIFMRFQQKEDIAKFQSSPYYSKILDEHGSVSVDFESEVEDDIIPLFRRGEDFNYGVEFMLLISFLESVSGDSVEDALASLQKLISQCSSFIVQATLGCCLNHMDSGYSHAAVIRFPSFDDFKLFREGMEYKDMWASKFQPIVEKSLELYFTVDPVGNQLM